MTRCFVGLGANLGNSLATLQQAAHALQQWPDLSVTARSTIYRSAPLGPQDQPDYLNAVLAIDTSLTPLALLDCLQALEQKAGRERTRHWGPRTLDLDLLLYGCTVLQSDRLTLPHPHMMERNFVLRPLADIVTKNWQFPDGSTLAQRLDACPGNELSITELRWKPAQAEAHSA